MGVSCDSYYFTWEKGLKTLPKICGKDKPSCLNLYLLSDRRSPYEYK